MLHVFYISINFPIPYIYPWSREMFRSFLLIFCKGKSSAWLLFIYLFLTKVSWPKCLYFSSFAFRLRKFNVLYIYLYFHNLSKSIYFHKTEKCFFCKCKSFFFHSWQRSRDRNVAATGNIGFLAGYRSMQDFFILHISCIQRTCLQTFRCARGVWIEKTKRFFFRVLLLQKARVKCGP